MSLFGSLSSVQAPRQRPLEIARDTYSIRALTASVGGSWTNLNSIIIRAKEPIIIDCGMSIHREIWFEDVLSIVSASEVRWIFITHNDSDHSGNLVEALERFPNASLITSHGESYRTAASFGIPIERMRMVDHGGRFHVGDRELVAIRPPVYDSPYTRGVFDPSTGVYYASDAFCAPMPEAPVDWADDITPTAWANGMAQFHHVSLCPWIAMIDPTLFRREVDKIATLEPRVIAGAHTPAISKTAIPRALEQLANLPLTAPQTSAL